MQVGFAFDDNDEYRREAILLNDSELSEPGKYRCQYVCLCEECFAICNFEHFEPAPIDKLPRLRKILKEFVDAAGII